MTTPQNIPDLPPALAELAGTVLEQRYQLGRVLGAGGMGAVFEARHLRLDRPVAIKVLRPSYAGEGEYIERFLREAKSASKIRHRNVVEILDYGEAAGGLVYSVMEFLVGQDLQQLLAAQPDKRLPWPYACGLLVQIASGLKAAHGQGVIHRDIKPANCFLTDEDEEPVVKLVDFGIAKLEGSDRGHTLTGTAQVLGTPSYIAPEMVRTQNPASPQSDIYALGVVAYRMLTGQVPFTAGTVFEILRKACFDPVPSMRAHVPEIPPAVEAFVEQMLAKEPAQRPVDMRTVRDQLVALSRETIGAQAVEIPGSSALPMSVVDSVPPPGAMQAGAQGVVRTTVPASVDPPPAVDPHEPTAASVNPAVRARTTEPASGSPPSARTTTAVLHLPESIDSKPAQTAGTMGADAARAPKVLVGAPLAPVHDPTSVPSSSPSPSRSGETMPAVGESTLRSIEASGSIERPQRRGGLWLAVGVAGAMAAIGALVVPAMLGDGRDASTPAAAELATVDADSTPNALPVAELAEES
ncbi:MAG: protein kinase, partial [Myxococcota bacterium]